MEFFAMRVTYGCQAKIQISRREDGDVSLDIQNIDNPDFPRGLARIVMSEKEFKKFQKDVAEARTE